jgi:hypothetical protein
MATSPNRSALALEIGGIDLGVLPKRSIVVLETNMDTPRVAIIRIRTDAFLKGWIANQ